MKFHLAAPLLAAVAAASAPATPPSTSVTFRLAATHQLPNPYALPPSTHATLTALHHSQRAPLSTTNTFVFRNVSAGSFLVDVHSPTHAFAPLRLDVVAAGADDGGLVLRAWETFRGNDWDNKGEALVGPGPGGEFEVRSAIAKDYFVERSSFSVFSILRNPMILLGMVSMGVVFGMPYLINNMDPEMRAEFEEQQKSNPMGSLLGAGGGQAGANPLGNFDMAAYLAGSSSKKDDDDSAAKGSGKEGKRKR